MWQTRTLATFIAATVPSDHGESPLLEQAMALGRTDEEQAAESAEPAGAAEPAVGSFEGFMSSFGAPRRWAGH